MSTPSIYSPQVCEAAAAFRRDPTFAALFAVQVVFSALSVGTIGFLLRSPRFHKETSILNRNLKFLIAIGALLFLFIGCLMCVGLYGYLFVLYFMPFPDCGFVWSAWTCYLLRAPLHYTIVGYSIWHTAILCERIYSTFSTSDRLDAFGVINGILLLFVPALLVLFMYWDEPLSGEHRTYCLAGSSVSSGRILIVTYGLAILDILTAIADFVLFAYNRKQVGSDRYRFDVNKSFRVREMQVSIRVIFPISIIHVLAFLPWPILYAIGKSLDGIQTAKFVEWASVFRAIYATIVPLAFFVLQRRRTGQVDEWRLHTTEFMTSQYFEQLRRQFE